jgi:hypothetical protein
LQSDDRNPELCIIDKFLGANDVTALCERLKENSHKKRVILKGNRLGVVVLRYCRGPEGKQSIEVLSPEWNQLGNDGALRAVQGPWKLRALEEIDLRNNNIKSEGAIAIAKAVMANGAHQIDRIFAGNRIRRQPVLKPLKWPSLIEFLLLQVKIDRKLAKCKKYVSPYSRAAGWVRKNFTGILRRSPAAATTPSPK